MADTSSFAAPPLEPKGSMDSLTAGVATGLLTGCRDRLAYGLATIFAQHLGSANADFLGMCDRATSLEQQQLFVSAMDFLNDRGQDLLQQFRIAYVACFDASVAALQSTQPEPDIRDTDDLRLVDTADFERDLAIGKLSARAACNCSQQLTALDRRLAALLRVPRVSQDDNPLYPRTLFGAMLQALKAMDVQDQLALILLQEFERQTSVELPGVYADLNRFLVQAGVLPTIPLAGPLSVPRSEASDQGAGGAPGWAGFEPSEDPALLEQMEAILPGSARHADGQRGAEVFSRLSNDDVFGQLARAIQTASRGRVNPGVIAGVAQKVGAATKAGQPQVLGISQILQALNGLQRGNTDMRQIPGLSSVHIDPARGNVLQQIRSTPMMMWSQPLDALTIDIVAMLFDAIFNDPDLSASVRAELAKLQIPVLKVALVDKSFFSDRRHPARRLLDVIASSGIGRNEMDEPHLVDKIREIVDAVVAGFDADVNIFSIQILKVEEFLREEEARVQAKSLRVSDQLEQRDRQEIAAERIGRELEARTHAIDLPVLVAGFLNRHWRSVLSDVFVRTGDAGPQWSEAIGTMDELIWSVQPKEGIEERNRLLTTLPDLLKRLRRGLDTVDLQEVWDPFFDRLIRLHMRALNKEMPADQSVDEDSVEPMPSDDTEVSSRASPGSESPSSVQDESELEDPYLDLAKSLEVGDWVEFQSFRGTRRTLRLGWVSKYRGVYLFTNRQGDNALTLATTSLAGHLRKGTARVLSQDPLTDRAVAQVFEQVMPETVSHPRPD